MATINTAWRRARIVSLKGLRRRARGTYQLGEIVDARTDEPLPGDTEQYSTRIKGRGISGCDAVVPNSLVEFLD